MSWFQLDPQSVLQRLQASGRPAEISCPGTFLQRGIIGFTIVSVAGFAPWAIWGRWMQRHFGELGMYVICALVFIGLAGPLMHRLIIGPGSLSRFYKLFGLSFAAYSVAWIGGWMALRGHVGSVVGLLAGAAVMGWIMTRAFEAGRELHKVVASLYLLNAAGYFLGGVVEAAVGNMKGLSMSKGSQMMIAKSLWGVCYGIGFGAGLGLAYYICQTKTRELLRPQGTAEK